MPKGRPKTAGLNLPKFVYVRKNRKGVSYYYYAPNGWSKPYTALGRDLFSGEFWSKLHGAADQDIAATENAKTFARLITEYRSHRDYTEWLRPKTRKNYDHYLDRLLEAAGEKLVADLSRADVYQMRDAVSDKPVAANQMISVLRTLIEWGIPRGFRNDNPAQNVKKLNVDENGAKPWPEEGFEFVMNNAPENLRRMAYLGRATGQRREDLVEMRGCDLEHDGINLVIRKRRGVAHFVPLLKADMIEIKSWGVGELEHFLLSNTGRRYPTGDALYADWKRWRKSPEAEPIKDLHLTPHGLRATAVSDRRASGSADGSIADELYMSVAMVTRYSRFADKRQAARASRDRRELKAG